MPITPGTPLASGDLPAATADAQANAAALRTAIGAMENTAGAVLDKLQGAAEDPERIGAEYMPTSALLEDENGNVPVDGALFANTAGVALAAGVVGWNNTLGCLVRHDGTTVGGNVIRFDDPFTVRGTMAVAGTLAASADAEVVIETFPITALQAVLGSKFTLSGRIVIDTLGTTLPATAYIGLLADTGIGHGVVFGFDLSGMLRASMDIIFNIELVELDAINFVITDVGGSIGCFTKLIGSTTSMTSEAIYTSTAESGAIGEAQDLSLVLQLPMTASCKSYMVMYDLKLEQTA